MVAAATRFRLVVFDFDGTLADSFPWFAAELNAAARRWGFRPVAPAEREALRHHSAGAILRALGVARWKIPWIARDLRARMAEDIASIRPFDGVPEMLSRLAEAERRLAIATSNTAANVAAVLGAERWAELAALECGIALGGKHRRLRRLCRRLGVPRGEAIYIGDEVRDIAAARRAGLAAGAVTWGYNREPALRAQHPDQLFRDVAEIPALLLGVPARASSVDASRAAPS